MSDATTPPPSQADLDANSFPALMRRDPQYTWIVSLGVMGGAAFGTTIGLLLPGSGAMHRVAVTLLVALGAALIGGIIVGAAAPHTPRQDLDEVR